jgi:hypothetical protein
MTNESEAVRDSLLALSRGSRWANVARTSLADRMVQPGYNKRELFVDAVALGHYAAQLIELGRMLCDDLANPAAYLPMVVQDIATQLRAGGYKVQITLLEESK